MQNALHLQSAVGVNDKLVTFGAVRLQPIQNNGLKPICTELHVNHTGIVRRSCAIHMQFLVRSGPQG